MPLFCYRLSPPEINTHLSARGKQAAADVYDMRQQTCVSMCVFVRVCVHAIILHKSDSAPHISANFLTQVENLNFQFMAAGWQLLLVFFSLFHIYLLDIFLFLQLCGSVKESACLELLWELFPLSYLAHQLLSLHTV